MTENNSGELTCTNFADSCQMHCCTGRKSSWI